MQGPCCRFGAKLGLSRTTVQDRLKRLEEQGVIAGYNLEARPRYGPCGHRSPVAIAVEPRRQIEVAQGD